ncbi:MAG: 1-deoxy-D-xylulose-5-phosphate synthase [Candidatus Nanopelagicales bacterium]|nr:1-deoxy-D-xylulose-5-phosphate synthase [Candidatus Nanopelagicales bacterium]MCU0298753.1 1-deoxy-D-xylulose-5-phosphate synthase [Candidatus Nanopelagicales bacterium]
MLEKIHSPADLRSLDDAQLDELAAEIREFLVAKVSRTGGHLGPNLGVVELTLALHRVFDSPKDAILWDTGHQAYVHKLLTGRQAGFDVLRQEGGLSGYPSRAESEHDWIENSHASTSLSYADGLAKAWQARGLLGSRNVVAIIGDGALTGGMAWEALNNIADSNRSMVIVVNDNERSYDRTIGGLANHLATLRTTGGYERFLEWGRRVLDRTPVVGRPAFDTLHGLKKGLKDVVAPQGMFEDLGLKYLGPVPGHDREAVEQALRRAKGYGGPVLVHVLTQKGRGYPPAEQDEADRFHGVPVIDPVTGRPAATARATWTSVFSEEMCAAAARRPDVVAITAAMLGPTGLAATKQQFPERVYDVGIAEQHAITSAVGMAMGGLHPVVALYATFVNRAFDQVLMDAALHKAGITIVLDRAGITGDDGASHNGMWDMSILQVIPGLRLAAPRDGSRLRESFREALDVADAPTVVRFPKGSLPADIPAIRAHGAVDVLAQSGADDVLIVAVGSMAGVGVEVASRLAAQEIGATVVDPRWVKPVPAEIIDLARQHRLVVTLEDNGVVGGVGAAVAGVLREQGITTTVRTLGIPQEFLDQGSRAQLLERVGLTAQQIGHQVIGWVAASNQTLETDTPSSLDHRK